MYPPIEGFYDPETSAALVTAAAAAYRNDRAMAAWAEMEGCEEWQAFGNERTDTAGFVAANEETAFVVFRGTRDLRNWITDLDARRVHCGLRIADCGSEVEVHKGFLRALDSVWDVVAALLEGMAAERRDLFFTGHSLGGALAMLACARWDGAHGKGECPVSWLYSFGQPRVGNKGWKRWYDGRLQGRSFRVVHAEDVVARMPWLLGMFRHCGREVFYDAAGVSHVGMNWWEKAGAEAAGLYKEWKHGPAALLRDHRVESYVEMVSAQIGGGRRPWHRIHGI